MGAAENGTGEEGLDFSNLPEEVWFLWDGDKEDSPIARLKERTTEQNLSLYREKMVWVQPHLFWMVISRNGVLTNLIGLAKILEDVPVYNEEQHLKVIDDWDEKCASLGMPQSLLNKMHRFIVFLLELSVEHQEDMAADPQIRQATEDWIEGLFEGWKQEKERTRLLLQPGGVEPLEEPIPLPRASSRRKPQVSQ